MTRGMELFEKVKITENEDGSFAVPSQTSVNTAYEVRIMESVWVCTCPDFENRANEITFCKHIHAVKFWIASQTQIQNKPKPKVFADDAIQCPSCGSIKMVRYGHSDGKQIFKCRDCGKKSREGILKRAQYSPETISLTLDLYFSGMSLRKIARTLNDHFEMDIGNATVYRWISRYIPMISEYVNSLAPQLSETWHADELFVKMKGGDSNKKFENIAYLWNIMDRKTRFLIASKLSKRRDDDGAIRAMMDAKKNAHESLPEKILTDGLKAYNEGIKYNWSNERVPEHIARCGIKKPHANNNRIERMNGTLRERVKVQRGWKKMSTALAEGQRIQYNFVKPHMALEGQTPAQVAGIGVNSKDKWAELLEKALSNQGEAN